MTTIIDALEIALYSCNSELIIKQPDLADCNYEEMVIKTEKIQELLERLSN